MNLRPPGYEPDELPSCSTPRHSVAFIGDIDYYTLFQRFCQEGAESFFAAEAEDENAAADLLSRKPAATPIHAPPRGATLCLPALPSITAYFNSRPSARGDSSANAASTTPSISIHAPPRGATASSVADVLLALFQFTPLREGRRKSTAAPPSYTLFQFTPLREGRPGQKLHRQARKKISIHAPPRGATVLSMGFTKSMIISIHAPPRGATVSDAPAVYFQCSFQFTPLREGRHSLPACLAYSALISIHAPPRGATSAVYSLSAHALFQFTPLREGRQKVQPALFMISLFQFTPLREGRPPEGRACRRCTTNFNSRPSARGDETAGSPLHSKVVISIHAPPRGATARFARI